MEKEWAAAEEAEEASGAAAAGGAALHARLVALVRAASGEPEGRVGVWMEHSYARAKSGVGAVRELLARPPERDADADAGELDVGGVGDDAPPALPAPPEPADDGDPDWETRVWGLAPHAGAASALRAAAAALRALRLARLAGAGVADRNVRRDDARAAARKVRRALAPLWAGSRDTAAWLHGAVLAHASRADAALWREVAGELARAVPRLAAPLLPAPPPPRADPDADTGSAVSAEAPGPWLAWVSARADGRWARRLRALLHVREVRADADADPAAAPEARAAAAAAAARAALLDVLADAGSRPVVAGGAGAGAALLAALLAGAGAAGAPGATGTTGPPELGAIRALALLAPPLLTAEGEVTHLHRSELDVPLLVVAGGAGAACARSAACALLGDAGEAHAGEGAARRVLVVRGADDALRLPARLRRRRAVPQHALDAAVAEEVARWALTAAEGEPRRSRRGAAAVDAGDERRAPLHDARGLLRELEPVVEAPRPARTSSAVAARRAAAAPAPAPAAAPLPVARVQELDIMQLPIVFADDEAAPPPPPPPPVVKRQAAAAAAASGARPSVTVTSGHPRGGRALNYTRVIVAKRRGAGPRGARGGAARGAVRGAPVLLRRTVRLVRGRDS